MNKPNTDSQPKTVGWDNINWHQVDRYVFKLQKRIYAASRRGEVKKVRKLQKTLYYQFSDAQSTKKFPEQDKLIFQKLRAWGRYRCKSLKSSFEKYFTKIGNRNWIFATKEGNANPSRLLLHEQFGSSSTDYVKVKSDKSPYDGNLIYWSTRMGRHHDMPTSKAYKLKKQKGKCNWCGLHFREGDILEEDHIVATALGGKNIYDNLQLLHGHCHDEKTALDLIDIRKKQLSNFLKKLHKEWSKVDYLWIDDLPVIFSS